MKTVLWLAGQFLIVAAGGTVIIASVVVVWYILSLAVLTVVSRLFPLTGSTRRVKEDQSNS